MTDILTHWKKLDNPDYLGAYSLQPGEEPVLTIKQVLYQAVKGEGGKKDDCRVAHFVEGVKPMILNATNCKTITKLYGTPFIENWAGAKIQVYATTTKLAGEEVECLRIRPKKPIPTKATLSKDGKSWPRAMEAVKNGETSIQNLQDKYNIPPDSLELLQEVMPDA